jgi:uncharacterized protein YjbJ (UPF0337 family)
VAGKSKERMMADDDGTDGFSNKAEALGRTVTGRVQDAVGGLTGDAATQMRGKFNQAAGKAQDIYGDAVEEMRHFAADQPMAAILLSVGFGFLLGVIVARR